MIWTILITVILGISFYSGLVFDRMMTQSLPRPEPSQYASEDQIKQQIRNLILQNPAVRFDQLETALAHPSDSIRYLAILALKYDYSPGVIQFMCDRAVHDPSPSIRILCMRDVSQKQPQTALPLIVALLIDPSEDVRGAALRELAQSKQIDPTDMILAACSDRPPTRGELRALSILGGEEAIAFLLKIVMSQSQDSGIAIRALSTIGDTVIDAIDELNMESLNQEQLLNLVLVLDEITSPRSSIVINKYAMQMKAETRRRADGLLRNHKTDNAQNVNPETPGSTRKAGSKIPL